LTKNDFSAIMAVLKTKYRGVHRDGPGDLGRGKELPLDPKFLPVQAVGGLKKLRMFDSFPSHITLTSQRDSLDIRLLD
jgi:hypothetical protein